MGNTKQATSDGDAVGRAANDGGPVAVVVWDAPTRVLHALLVIGVVAAFGLAMVGDREGAGFSLHMIIGLSVGLVVLLRLVWAAVGTKHARFAEFAYGPAAVAGYLRGVLRGNERQYGGHNPASAWVGLILLLLSAGVVGTGIALGREVEAAEEVHGAMAWAIVILGLLHLAGVVLHTIRHHDNISMGMVTGQKQSEPGEAIGRTYFWVGMGMLAMVIGFGGSLWRSYDAGSGTTRWPIVGTPLPLGEGQDDERGQTDSRGPERDWDRPRH